MTDDRSLERAARSWIEVGPTRAPDDAVETALARIQTTSQERDWFPWRFPLMLTPARLAAATLVGVLLVGGAFFALARLPAVGGPVPSAVPSPSPVVPSASPAASAVVPVAMPAIVLGDWQAEADALLGINEAGERIQLSLDWQEGKSAWIQPPRGDLVHTSTSLAAAEGELRFFSTARLGGCNLRDEGRYRWERSEDGMFLTLTVIEDACAARAAAFGRTWVHSLSAVNDGGLGVIPFSDRWIEATIPSRRWGLGGDSDAVELRTFDEADPALALRVLRNPMGLSEPCDESRVPIVIDRTAAAFVDYVENDLPGLAASAVDTVVDGHPAVRLTVASDDGTVDCTLQSTGEVMAFHAMAPTAEAEWGLTPLGPHTMWIVEVDGDTYLLWYEGDGVTLADQQAVIDSIRFLDVLPTP